MAPGLDEMSRALGRIEAGLATGLADVRSDIADLKGDVATIRRGCVVEDQRLQVIEKATTYGAGSRAGAGAVWALVGAALMGIGGLVGPTIVQAWTSTHSPNQYLTPAPAPLAPSPVYYASPGPVRPVTP